jgi:hypothetical protein
MRWSTGRLSRAFEVQSVVRLLDGERGPEKLEGPAATLAGGGLFACDVETRDLTTPHTQPANEGVDMTKSTRGFPRSDSRTRASAVKITPATHSGPVTTTPTVA